MSTLHRLETKLENVPTTLSKEIQSLRGQMPRSLDGTETIGSLAHHSRSTSSLGRLERLTSQALTPEAMRLNEVEHDDQHLHPNPTEANGLVSISFSQHGVISWAGAQEILPQQLLEAHEKLGKNYVIDIEMKRPQLPMYICPFPAQAGDNWLNALPLAMVKGLSDAYFTTFNLFTPIIDKNYYYAFTLGAAIESNFGYNIESCVVLNIMALGCIAVHAYQEGDFPLLGTRSGRFEPPDWMGVVYENPPGLRFFNTARQRIGFLMCDNNLQSCQFYLVSL